MAGQPHAEPIPDGMRLSIVLPCYNEADNLPPLVRRYREVWEDLPAELILVDNGSTDRTAEVLRDLLARPEYHFARTVSVETNRGYGHGVHVGLQAAKGEFLAFSHADMQCNPGDVFSAFHKLEAMPDLTRGLVKGNRARRGWRAEMLTGGMGWIATAVLGTRLRDINAQPKVFHRRHLKQLVRPPQGIEYDLYVVYMARISGMSIDTVEVVVRDRAHGTSKWSSSALSASRTILATLGYMFRLRRECSG